MRPSPPQRWEPAAQAPPRLPVDVGAAAEALPDAGLLAASDGAAAMETAGAVMLASAACTGASVERMVVTQAMTVRSPCMLASREKRV